MAQKVKKSTLRVCEIFWNFKALEPILNMHQFSKKTLFSNALDMLNEKILWLPSILLFERTEHNLNHPTGEVKSVEFLFSCTCYQKTNSKHKIMSLSLWRYDEIFPSSLLRHEPLQDKQVETMITQRKVCLYVHFKLKILSEI